MTGCDTFPLADITTFLFDWRLQASGPTGVCHLGPPNWRNHQNNMPRQQCTLLACKKAAFDFDICFIYSYHAKTTIRTAHHHVQSEIRLLNPSLGGAHASFGGSSVILSCPTSLDMLQLSRTWLPATNSWSHNKTGEIGLIHAPFTRHWNIAYPHVSWFYSLRFLIFPDRQCEFPVIIFCEFLGHIFEQHQETICYPQNTL